MLCGNLYRAVSLKAPAGFGGVRAERFVCLAYLEPFSLGVRFACEFGEG